jgi:hypothetical protein
VVTVADDECKRRAERPSVAKTGEHLDLVLLDPLPRAPAVALLAAVEVGVDRRPVEQEARGKAGHDRDERGAMGLPRGGERERHVAKTRRPGGLPPGKLSFGLRRSTFFLPSVVGGERERGDDQALS